MKKSLLPDTPYETTPPALVRCVHHGRHRAYEPAPDSIFGIPLPDHLTISKLELHWKPEYKNRWLFCEMTNGHFSSVVRLSKAHGEKDISYDSGKRDRALMEDIAAKLVCGAKDAGAMARVLYAIARRADAIADAVNCGALDNHFVEDFASLVSSAVVTKQESAPLGGKSHALLTDLQTAYVNQEEWELPPLEGEPYEVATATIIRDQVLTFHMQWLHMSGVDNPVEELPQDAVYQTICEKTPAWLWLKHVGSRTYIEWVEVLREEANSKVNDD